jgi:hypothetical protein
VRKRVAMAHHISSLAVRLGRVVDIGRPLGVEVENCVHVIFERIVRAITPNILFLLGKIASKIAR